MYLVFINENIYIYLLRLNILCTYIESFWTAFNEIYLLQGYCSETKIELTQLNFINFFPHPINHTNQSLRLSDSYVS